MEEQERKTVEVRGFLQLAGLFKKRNWPVPLIVDLAEPTTGSELAERLEIPLAEVEIIFINGDVQRPKAAINPGDRVAFVPPGCPGPHRMHLGFYNHNQDNKYSFKKKESSVES